MCDGSCGSYAGPQAMKVILRERFKVDLYALQKWYTMHKGVCAYTKLTFPCAFTIYSELLLLHATVMKQITCFAKIDIGLP